jgi:hypothetical protein
LDNSVIKQLMQDQVDRGTRCRQITSVDVYSLKYLRSTMLGDGACNALVKWVNHTLYACQYACLPAYEAGAMKTLVDSNASEGFEGY